MVALNQKVKIACSDDELACNIRKSAPLGAVPGREIKTCDRPGADSHAKDTHANEAAPGGYENVEENCIQEDQRKRRSENPDRPYSGLRVTSNQQWKEARSS